MKEKINQKEAWVLFEKLLDETIKKEELKHRIKKVLIAFFISVILLILLSLTQLLIVNQIYTNSESLSNYNYQFFRKVFSLDKDQAVYSIKKLVSTIYTATEDEEVTLLSDSLKDEHAFSYRYLIKTKSGITGRTKYINRSQTPHISLDSSVKSVTQLNTSDFTTVFKNLQNLWDKEFRHTWVYGYLVLHDASKGYLFVVLFVLFLWILSIKHIVIYPLYGKINSNGEPQLAQIRGIAITIGIVLGFLSSIVDQEAAIYFTSGYHVFFPPSGGQFESYTIYLIWIVFLSSMLFMFGSSTMIEKKYKFNLLVFPTLFLLYMTFSFHMYSVLTFIIGLIFTYFLEALGGWSSLIELLILLSIIYGLFSGSKHDSKTLEQLKSEAAQSQKEASRKRKIEAENIAISTWNRANPNNPMAFRE